MFVSGLYCKENPGLWISTLLTLLTVCIVQHHPKKMKGQLILITFPVSPYLRSLSCHWESRILPGFLWPSWDSDCSSTASVFACCPAFCKEIWLSFLDYMSAVRVGFQGAQFTLALRRSTPSGNDGYQLCPPCSNKLLKQMY